MNRRVRFIVPAVVLMLLCACVRHQPLPDRSPQVLQELEVERIADLAYTPDGWPQVLTGDIHRPRAPGNYPGLLMVHGGGWTRGSRADTDAMAKAFAARGFVVFNISHRFAPKFIFPSQVQDVQQALRWFRAHAERYDVDAERIAGYGYSSGAHLVAMLATLSPGDALYGGDETRLQAAVLGGAPTDLRRFTDGTLVPDFLGVSHAQGYARYVASSPVTYVSADDPAMFLYHGGLDLLVDAVYAEEMQAALQAAGVRNELYLDRSKGHVSMFLINGAADRAATQFLLQVLAD